MRLVHFSDKKLTRMRTVEQWPAGKRPMGRKPRGLWVSDEDDHGWKAWCMAEDVRTERLKYEHEITLAPDAKILFIRSGKELDKFTKEYRDADSEINNFPRSYDYGISFTYEIDWQRVAKKYQGIVITPYLRSRRFALHCHWYYGWDCASGCIWGAKAVRAVKLIQKRAASRV